MAKNMVAISTFMVFSKPAKPPAATSAPPASACPIAPHGLGIASPLSVAAASPQALVSAALTETVHSTRYATKYHRTQRGRWVHQPSTAVVPVASCQRAMPSFSTALRKAARTTTQTSARPCREAAMVADTMSPAPIPAAATSRPGPIWVRAREAGGVTGAWSPSDIRGCSAR
jgi:hypothetical protein